MFAGNIKAKAFFASVAFLSGMAFAQVPMPLPISSPQAGMQMSPYAALKFRDPSKAMTIGEISELQAKKVNSELYRKFGYSDVEPIKVKPKVEAPVKLRPIVSVITLAVWGKPDALQAEAMVNGVLKKLKGGETLAPGVVLTKITPSGLQLEVPVPVVEDQSKKDKNSKNSAKGAEKTDEKRVEPPKFQSKIAYVGRGLEIRL